MMDMFVFRGYIKRIDLQSDSIFRILDDGFHFGIYDYYDCLFSLGRWERDLGRDELIRMLNLGEFPSFTKLPFVTLPEANKTLEHQWLGWKMKAPFRGPPIFRDL